MIRVLTPAERAVESAEKRRRAEEQVEVAVDQGWRKVDPSNEVFIILGHSPEDAFTRFKMRNTGSLSYRNVFDSFIDEEIIYKLIDDFNSDPSNLVLQERKSRSKRIDYVDERHLATFKFKKK